MAQLGGRQPPKLAFLREENKRVSRACKDIIISLTVFTIAMNYVSSVVTIIIEP